MKLIHFKDEGQDFTKWVVGDDGVVIESHPFQTSTWKGTVIFDLDKVKKGDQLTISLASDNRVTKLIHPVESIEDRPGVPDDYTYEANARGYTISFKGKPVGGASILDSAPAPRGQIAAANKRDNAKSARYTINSIILGQDKTRDKILNQYAEEAKQKATKNK